MIRFPGLGLEFQVERVAFHMFSIPIYWYAILITIPILIFLVASKKISERYKIKYEEILNLLVLLIPISLVCARIYYVAFSLDYYMQFPAEVFNLRDGGMAIYGGIIGGVITIYLFCKKKKIEFLEVTDMIVPFLALGQSIGRWGNFINQEAYGSETTLPWGMEVLENGITKVVHPTFLYESIATLIIAVILFGNMKKRKFKGETTYLYIVAYSLIRMLIEGLRIDSLLFYNFRISQIVSFIAFVIFCGILTKKKKEHKKTRNSLGK